MANKVKTPNLNDGETKLNKELPASVNKKLIEADVERERLKNEDRAGERGALGKYFGSVENSSNNIAGVLICSLLIIGTLYTTYMIWRDYSETHSQVLDFWNIIVPLITLSIGYLFGHTTK